MFKTVSAFKLLIDQQCPELSIETSMEEHSFVPCEPSQARSVGWAPPRGEEHGDLCVNVGGQLIFKLMIETKKVPSDVLDRKLQEKCVDIEQTTGRKPGKKEKREIKEELILELLPHAFATRSSVWVWVDSLENRVVLDASGAKADIALTTIVRTFSTWRLTPIATKSSPAAEMAIWLAHEATPEGFTADRSCELKACDESKAKVKYDNHALDIEEVQNHIRNGKIPTKLAMTWNDHVSFVLTDSMVLKRVELLDVVMMDRPDDQDAFDCDIALITGELSLMLPDLFDALGGEVQIETPKEIA